MRNRVAFLILVGSIVLAGCNSPTNGSGANTSGTTAKMDEKTSKAATKKVALSKLTIDDETPGKGASAAVGDRLYMKYVGRLADGTRFDGNEQPDGKPFTFTLGMGEVIKGWDEGLVGAKKGGKRKLGIPWELAYGEAGSSAIPGKSDLYFDVEVIEILKKADEQIVIATDVKKGTGAVAKTGSKVTIHYVGTLITGTTFDSSRTREKPFTFTIGQKEVVPGFESGVEGMRVGGVRNISIPPMLGYGIDGQGEIPPNSIIKFEIELLSVK